MYKLIIIVLLAIGVVGITYQVRAESSADIAQGQTQISEDCIGRVDPVNPSPLTQTDLVMLYVACMQTDVDQENVLYNTETSPDADRLILYRAQKYKR